MQEVLTIWVDLADTYEVQGASGMARLLPFTGRAEGPDFTGVILPGGVDTQRRAPGGCLHLSARYMLEGTDSSGAACRIFVENNAVTDADGKFRKTRPAILTDSPVLAWLESAQLEGTLTSREKGVLIRIFARPQP